jgi:ABC-type enterochelin transport system permease subunit
MMRILLVFLLLLSVAADAAAYLDPATGSIILQGLIAGVAAFIAFVRNPIQTIKGFFARFSRAPAPPPAGDGSPQD